MDTDLRDGATQTPGVYPYLLRLWGGGAEAAFAALGIQPNEPTDVPGDGPHVAAVWFPTAEARERFIAQLSPWPNLMRDRVDATEEAHPEVLTRARVTLRYLGQPYTFVVTYGYGYPWETVSFMWDGGNYGCDCNRSLFLRRQCGVVLPPEALCEDDDDALPCGHTIELVGIEDVSVRPSTD